MKKIGFRVGTYCAKNNLTGVGRVAKNVIEQLTKCASDYTYMLLEEDRIGVDIPADSAAISVHSAQMVSLQCMTHQIDLVHSFYDPCTDFKGKTRRILTIHDLVNAKFPQWAGSAESCRVWREQMLEAAAGADFILADSAATKNDIVNDFKIPPEKIKVVYYGVDGRLSEKRYQKDCTSAKFGLRERYILSVCTLEPRKNLSGLVRAFGIYKARFPDDAIQLVIVGKTGWMTQPIFESIQQSPYARDIVLTGYVTDTELLSLYKNCLFAAYPSFYEGFGLPVLEAVSLGKTVLCSNTSSMPEVGGDAAEYCNPYDLESIEAGIETLAQNDEWRRQLEKRTAAQAAGFGYSKAAEKIMSVYRALLNEDGRITAAP